MIRTRTRPTPPPNLSATLALLLIVAFLVPGLLPVPASAQATAPSPNPVLSLAVAPGAPERVLAGVLNSPQPAAIWRSQDGAVTWQNTTPSLAPNVSIAALTFDPRNQRIAYAADGGSGILLRSSDGGLTWAEVPAIRSLISSNSAIGELFARTEGSTTAIYAGTRFDGVLRSTDDGQSWQQLDAGLVGEARRIRKLIDFNGDLYAGTHDGLYRLPQGASTWEPVPGFTDGGIVYSAVVKADATQGNVFYVGSDTALYASPDGSTWTRVPNTPTTTYYDIVDTGRLLVLATDTGMLVGAGEAWQPALVDGAPLTTAIFALANTPRAPRTIYAGGAESWVMRSDDEGVNFTSAAALRPLDVRAALATATPTATPTATATNTATPTATPTETATPTPSPTPTDTPTPTSTPPPTATRTPRPTATATNTPTGTATNVPTATVPQAATTALTATVAPTLAASPAITPGGSVTATGAITLAVPLPVAGANAPLTGALTSTVTDTAGLIRQAIEAAAPQLAGTGSSPEATAAPGTGEAVAEAGQPAAGVLLPTATVGPTPTPTSPPPTATVLPAAGTGAGATATVSSATVSPATPIATAEPTATAGPTPTPTATPIPIDIAAEVTSRLPIVFGGAALIFALVILTAGISIVRGPRDI